jgi:hypothetical protein
VRLRGAPAIVALVPWKLEGVRHPPTIVWAAVELNARTEIDDPPNRRRHRSSLITATSGGSLRSNVRPAIAVLPSSANRWRSARTAVRRSTRSPSFRCDVPVA